MASRQKRKVEEDPVAELKEALKQEWSRRIWTLESENAEHLAAYQAGYYSHILDRWTSFLRDRHDVIPWGPNLQPWACVCCDLQQLDGPFLELVPEIGEFYLPMRDAVVHILQFREHELLRPLDPDDICGMCYDVNVVIPGAAVLKRLVDKWLKSAPTMLTRWGQLGAAIADYQSYLLFGFSPDLERILTPVRCVNAQDCSTMSVLVGLLADHPDIDLRTSQGQHELFKQVLAQAGERELDQKHTYDLVGMLHRRIEKGLAQAFDLETPGSKSRSLTIDLDPAQAVLDGHAFALKNRETAIYLTVLLENEGQIVKPSKIEERFPEFEGARVERILPGLPPQLKELIKVTSRKGSQINLHEQPLRHTQGEKS